MTAGAAAPKMHPLRRAERQGAVGRIDLETQHRECLQCGGWLPFAAFSKHKGKTGGVGSTCKDCCIRRRRDAEAEVWAKLIDLLGAKCHTCGIDVPVVLRLLPLGGRAKMLYRRTGISDRKTSTLARLVLAGYEHLAGNNGQQNTAIRREWRLICLNCLTRSHHDDSDCPR